MASASALEVEIAQMEQRLASVKVTVDVEREAWQRAARTGKRGTKWKSAASSRHNTEPVSKAATEDEKPKKDSSEEPELTVMPSFWDPLELAQFLQTRQLPRFAQAVVNEQISCKMLLDTSPGRLRQLISVADAGDKDPNWKAFLRVCSYLQKEQKRLERITADAMGSARSDGSDNKSVKSKRGKLTASNSSGRSDMLVFPLISPRGIVGNSASGMNPGNNSTKAESVAPKRPGALRKAATQSSTSSSGLPMATCWSCGARFTRAIPPPTAVAGSTKAASLKTLLSARPFCSKQCRERIERSDMSVTPALSVSLQPVEDVKTTGSSSPPGGSKLLRPPAIASKISEPTNDCTSRVATRVPISVVIHMSIHREAGDELLQVAVTRLAQPEHPRPTPPSNSGPLAPPATCPSPTAQRGRLAKSHRGLATAQASFSSTQRSVASIPWTNRSVSGGIGSTSSCTVGTLEPNASAISVGNSSAATAQSRVYQQSRYKLDPEVFQAHRLTLSVVFGGFASGNQIANSPANYARGNLLKLQDFLSVRALNRLSLTSRAWHTLVTQPSALSDALWGVHVLRTWRQSEEDDELLQQIGVLPKPERPRRMLMKLTKQVTRVALENLKVLLSLETWQLAGVMAEADSTPANTLTSVLSSRRRRRLGSPPPSPRQQLAANPAELYECVSIIYNPSCEIVAVKAQQLLRPLDEKGATLTSVLQGLQRGELRAVHCRRLRLFSSANRLPFELWPLLPTTKAVFELFWTEQPDHLPVWHQKVLAKLQMTLQQRLLGKDSVQQVMRGLQERNGPPDVLIALEKFLIAAHGSTAPAPRSPRARGSGDA